MPKRCLGFEKLADFFIKNIGSIEEIEGLIYKENGAIKQNALNPPIQDLDALVFPDYSMLPLTRYFQIISGRGCPYNCIFCFQGVHGGIIL